MIKRQLLVITIILSNIAFTAVLSADVEQKFQNSVIGSERSGEFAESLQDASVAYLVDKGLDADVAQKRVNATFMHSKTQTQALVRAIAKNENVGYEDIVKYVANAALHRRKVDLSANDEIVALLQRKRV